MTQQPDRAPVKLAVIEQGFVMGGAEVNLLWLLPPLKERGFDSLVLCPREGEVTRRFSAADIACRIVPLPPLFSVSFRLLGRKVPNPAACLWDAAALEAAARRTASALRRAGAGLVLTNGLFAHIYGGRAAQIAGLPCVWHLQDIVSPTRAAGLFLRTLRRAALRVRPSIAAISAPVAEAVQGLGLPVTIVPNGASLGEVKTSGAVAAARAALGVPDGVPLAGIAGRITPWKGQLEFVQAAALVRQRLPRARFLIIGACAPGDLWYLRKVEEFIAESGLGSAVSLVGWQESIHEVMQALDVLVLASQEPEPFGRVLIEAMAVGTPVVATAHGGAAEIVEDGVTGLLVPPGDTGALAGAMQALLADPSRALGMGLAGRQVAEERYSLESFVRNMNGVLLSSLGQTRG